jgi:ATP-dependent Clp protease ATP-binding subunit ClpA
MWNRFDEELRKILAVAATLAEMEGKNYVSTTNFVKALMFLRPGNISDFFGELPEGALPEPGVTNVRIQATALTKLDSLSPCISSAISNLAPRITTEERLSSEDVYIDIARYAAGKSTQRLRCHGVNKENVEKIVRQLGWKLVERDVA